MDTVLNFMDKIYGDSKILTIIYIVGAILLFVFLILLIVSLKTPAKKKEKIIEEPKIDEIPKEKEEVKVNENIDNVENDLHSLKINKTDTSNMKSIESIADNIKIDNDNESVIDNKNINNDEKENTANNEELDDNNLKEVQKLSDEVPNIDKYVDETLKKTYEKNEQFSSVFVGDTTSIKLDKVLDNLNVDEDIKNEIVPEEEKTKEDIKEIDSVEKSPDNVSNENNESKEEPKTLDSKLDMLKKQLDEKKQEVEKKQDDLKAKLDSLKNLKNE